jgi:hypothetical protein
VSVPIVDGETGATSPVSSADGNAQPDDSVPEDMFRAREGRWGSREVQILEVALKDQHGQVSHVFQSGDALSVHVKVLAVEPVSDFAFGIGLFNPEGVCCYGTNTHLEELESASLEGEAEVVFQIASLDLVEGTYKLDVAVHKRDGYPYDYHRLLYTFRVKSRTHDVRIYRPPHQWTFSPNVKFGAK